MYGMRFMHKHDALESLKTLQDLKEKVLLESQAENQKQQNVKSITTYETRTLDIQCHYNTLALVIIWENNIINCNYYVSAVLETKHNYHHNKEKSKKKKGTRKLCSCRIQLPKT